MKSELMMKYPFHYLFSIIIGLWMALGCVCVLNISFVAGGSRTISGTKVMGESSGGNEVLGTLTTTEAITMRKVANIPKIYFGSFWGGVLVDFGMIVVSIFPFLLSCIKY